MISDNLQALGETFAKYRFSGMELEPEGVAGVIAVLNALTADAAELERQIVPDAARVDTANLPPNVLPFVARPRRVAPSSGDAA